MKKELTFNDIASSITAPYIVVHVHAQRIVYAYDDGPVPDSVRESVIYEITTGEQFIGNCADFGLNPWSFAEYADRIVVLVG